MTAKRLIAVFGPDNNYLSHCTWDRALGLLESGRAIKLNANSVRLKQTKKERTKKKHEIIVESKRICYICNTQIPENEIATIDHIIPKSRDRRADTYDNMRCCCSKCNNDKGNMTLSEYVKHVFDNREHYDYITDRQLDYLMKFAKSYEERFYKTCTHDIKPCRKSLRKRRRKRK
jgi:5-methylcytosine-specific restriction endonuclease McrA